MGEQEPTPQKGDQPGATPPAKPDGAGAAKKNAAEALAAEALAAAQQAIAGLDEEEGKPKRAGAKPGEAKPFEPPSLENAPAGEGSEGIDLLSDVDLDVKIELGRTRMFVEDVLRLREGAVVELDKLAGDPVDVYVNDRPVARGEVLILNDNFCVRVNEILSSAHLDT